MNETMVTREWYDEDNNKVYMIRFVKEGEAWYAVLKDICDALGLTAKFVAQRIDEEFLLKRNITTSIPFNKGVRCKDKVVSNNLMSKPYHNTHQMLLVNEIGIYQCIDGSRKLEARKFRRWYPQMISKLRQGIGLQGFMAMDMMNEDVQRHIDKQLDKVIDQFDPYLDNIFFDEETGKLMQSITVAGGDVEVVEYNGDVPDFYNLYSFK